MPCVETWSETQCVSGEPTRRQGCQCPAVLEGGVSGVESGDLSAKLAKSGRTSLWSSGKLLRFLSKELTAHTGWFKGLDAALFPPHVLLIRLPRRLESSVSVSYVCALQIKASLGAIRQTPERAPAAGPPNT